MPSRPPQHRPRLLAARQENPKAEPRQHDRRQSARERGYTWEWEKARKAWLVKHPDCVHCLAEGVVTSANVVDHIIPHKGDKVLFWDFENNIQSLCKMHHDRKTAAEDGGFGNAQKRNC